MIKQSQLQQALVTYLDREIAPLSNNMSSIQQLVFGVELGVLKRKSQTMLSNFINSPEAKALQITKDDEIDIDTLYSALSESMSKQGSIELIGIKFTNADVNKLYETIKEFMPNEAINTTSM